MRDCVAGATLVWGKCGFFFVGLHRGAMQRLGATETAGRRRAGLIVQNHTSTSKPRSVGNNSPSSVSVCHLAGSTAQPA